MAPVRSRLMQQLAVPAPAASAVMGAALALLVSRALAMHDVSATHLLADGRTEEHTEAMSRLLRIVGLPERDLFRSVEEQIDVACAMQEQRIAYVKNEKAGVEG